MHDTPSTLEAAPRSLIRLADHAGRVHSQFGEDGMLAKIFERLGTTTGYFVEFGAWDGKYLSNTYQFVERGWRGVLIEADAERFGELRRNFADGPVVLRHARVGLEGEQSLDRLLEGAGAPRTIDLLSIDIDGDDFAIWVSLRRHHSRCVIIEFNQSIPFDTEFVNPPGKHWGNSARSITLHANAQGYDLVGITEANLIFLERPLAAQAGLAVVELAEAPPHTRWFWGMDGTLLCNRACPLPPDGEVFQVPFCYSRAAQPLPAVLRSFPPKKSSLPASLFLLLLVRPRAALAFAWGQLRKRWRRR